MDNVLAYYYLLSVMMTLWMYEPVRVMHISFVRPYPQILDSGENSLEGTNALPYLYFVSGIGIM
jgi:hypothetical protein